MSRLSTCETPRLPHPKPPSGQADRIQSITVHSAAIPTALTNGRPRPAPDRARAARRSRPREPARSSGRSTPTHRTGRSSRSWRRRSPDRRRTPRAGRGAPRAAPRSQSSGAIATNAMGHRPAGGNANDSGQARNAGRSGARRQRGTRPQAQSLHSIFFLSASWLAVLHQEASLADELRLLDRDHPRLGRIGRQPLVLGEGQQDLFVLRRPRPSRRGLLLDEQLLDRLDVGAGRRGRAARWRRPGRPRWARPRRGRLPRPLRPRRLRWALRRWLMVSVISHPRSRSQRLDARGLYCRGMQMQPQRPTERRSGAVPFPSAEGSRTGWRNEMRTQETFGAATPGRRVLYSASWVLRRRRRSGGATRNATSARRGRSTSVAAERVTSAAGSAREDLAAERDGQDRPQIVRTRRPVNGSASKAAKSACIPGARVPFFSS